MSGEYKLLSTFPKRDVSQRWFEVGCRRVDFGLFQLTTLNRSDTLEQLKLYPQQQLILESV